jgi:hypothetical protein
MRPPAPHITFEIATWVPHTDLTEEERDDLLKQQQQQQETESSRPPTPGGDSTVNANVNANTNSPKSMDLSTPRQEAARLDMIWDATATTATPIVEAVPHPQQPPTTDEYDQQPPTKKIRITATPVAAQNVQPSMALLAGEEPAVVAVDNINNMHTQMQTTNPPQQAPSPPPSSPPLKKRRLYDDAAAADSIALAPTPTEQPLATEPATGPVTEAATTTTTTSAEQAN